MKPDGAAEMSAEGRSSGLPPKFGAGSIALAILLALVISLGGLAYYNHRYAAGQQAARDSVSTIADLKAQEIANWMKERRGDAEFIRGSETVKNLLANPDDPGARSAMLRRMQVLRDVYGYAAIFVGNAAGKAIVQDPSDYRLETVSVSNRFQIALRSQSVVLSDLSRDRPDGPILLSLLSPVADESRPNGPARGVVMLVVDPNTFLYPDIQKWPTQDKTGEAALVRREGDFVVLLSDERNQRDDALKVRWQISSNPRLPAAVAAQGVEGVIEGIDHRGIPVLAALRHIPESPWFLVVKIDQDEILAPLRLEAAQVAAITALLLTAGALGVSLSWWQQRLTFLRASEARFRTLIENAPVAISISRAGKTIYVNQKFCALYGIENRDAMPGHPIENQWAPEFRATVLDYARKRLDGLPAPPEYEGIGLRTDGTTFPVHVAVSTVDLPDGPASLACLSDISERKAAERSLGLFRALVDHSHDAIEVIDPPTGRFLDISEKACEVHGYSRAEFLSMTVPEIDPQFGAGGPQAWIDQVERLKQTDFLAFETVHRRKDGSTFPVEVIANYIKLERDFILAVVRDITDRKHAEERIRQLNRMYAALSNINQLIVRVKDRDAMLGAACRIAVEVGEFRMAWIGLAEETSAMLKPVASAGFVGKYLESVNIDPGDDKCGNGPSGRAFQSGEHQISNDIQHDPLMDPWRASALQHGFRSCAALPLKIDGKTVGVFTLYAAAAGFFDSDEVRLLDELAANIGFALELDQSEASRRQAELALQASERQFASAFEFATIGMALVSTAGRWLKVNRSLCQMTGYAAEELCAKSFPDITHPDDVERDVESMTQMLKGEIPSYQREKRYIDKAGQVIWVYLSVSLLRDEQGRPVHFIAQTQNLTERRKIEEQFRQAQKMEAIGQLAGGVAHDFNNILTAIILQAQLSVRTGDPAEILNGMREIRVAAERAAHLTRQLLLFSRKQLMQPRDLDVNELITNVANMLHRLIGENIQLQLQLYPWPLFAHADSGILDQVIMNLAVNARDAMPEGGSLIIKTSRKEVDEASVPPETEVRPGSHVCIEVRDTGTGIRPEDMAHIFEPFFTTKGPGKGTGLGLATVFGIVRQHRGFLKVSSEPGWGTQFQVFLPSAQATAPSSRSAQSAESRGGSETILLVEDEERVRQLARQLLEEFGYRVIPCRSGADALEVWQKQQNEIDLLLTDIVMPGGINGTDLAVRLRQDAPDLKVIFTSGYSAEAAGRKIDLNRSEDFLQKPFLPEKLLAVVRQCLDK
jgi:PAS domain S-box-containing protein